MMIIHPDIHQDANKWINLTSKFSGSINPNDMLIFKHIKPEKCFNEVSYREGAYFLRITFIERYSKPRIFEIFVITPSWKAEFYPKDLYIDSVDNPLHILDIAIDWLYDFYFQYIVITTGII